MTLIEYAEAIERSGKTQDLRVARYIRAHQARIQGWLQDALMTLGTRVTRADKEDLTQVALLAITQVVQAPNADAALNEVKNALQNQGRQQKAWIGRKVDILKEEN